MRRDGAPHTRVVRERGKKDSVLLVRGVAPRSRRPMPIVLAALLLAAAPTRLLVLNLEPVGVPSDVARSVDVLVAGAAASDSVELIAQSDIKRLAELEANKAELGCETSSCLAEVAGALGAQLVLFGSVSKLAGATTVGLSLYDNATGAVLRETVTVDDDRALVREVPTRVRLLVERATHGEPTPPPPLPVGHLVGVGAVAVGGAALLLGTVVATLNEVAIQDASALAATKRAAQEAGMTGVVIAAAGAGIAVAGGVVLLLVGDDP